MSVEFLVGDAEKLPFEENSFDLVIGSPPYVEQRTYGRNDVARATEKWIEWMLKCTHGALRVSKGPVIWIASGSGNYEPAVEGLIWFAYRNKWHVLRPCIWSKNAPPTGKDWFSNDWEFCAAFTKVKPLPYFNGESLEQPLKYNKGGAFRQRGKDGERKAGSAYPTHQFRKRPSNVFFHVTVGGGHLGKDKEDDRLACQNEAPFPCGIVEPFIKVLTPVGGRILDPFSGSGTTALVAHSLGRHGVGMDLRESQKELAEKRSLLWK